MLPLIPLLQHARTSHAFERILNERIARSAHEQARSTRLHAVGARNMATRAMQDGNVLIAKVWDDCASALEVKLSRLLMRNLLPEALPPIPPAPLALPNAAPKPVASPEQALPCSTLLRWQAIARLRTLSLRASALGF